MKKYVLLVFIGLLAFISNNQLIAQEIKAAPIEGRWDLTVDFNGRKAASWLEVRHSGIKTLTGRFVWESGSARPISEVFFKEGKVNFHIPAQFDISDKEMIFDATLKDDKLVGTIISPLGKTFTFTGARAPRLISNKKPIWGKAIQLFNGKDLDGWQTLGKNQ